MQPCILVVDDDSEICSLLTQFLVRHGFRVLTAADGQAMFEALASDSVDLVILDVMMPGEDGLALCRRLRMTAQIPVIMLTAMGDETDRIVGLELGADDYICKPFNPRELLARVKAVLRRTSEAASPTKASRQVVVKFAGWILDLTKRELRSTEQALVPLSNGEFDLLVAFVDHPQHVLSRDQLLDLARGRVASLFDRSIDVQVSRLRRKIEPNPEDPTLIKTVRSGGYIFTPTVARF